MSKLPPIDIPDDWSKAIDSRRGSESIPAYIRRLILGDMPPRVRASLSKPKPRGRPKSQALPTD